MGGSHAVALCGNHSPHDSHCCTCLLFCLARFTCMASDMASRWIRTMTSHECLHLGSQMVKLIDYLFILHFNGSDLLGELWNWSLLGGSHHSVHNGYLFVCFIPLAGEDLRANFSAFLLNSCSCDSGWYYIVNWFLVSCYSFLLWG